MRDFGVWPYYSASCRHDVDELLKRGGSMSAYRANKDYGSGPAKGSWAERLEREIEKKFKVKHAVAVNSGTAALHCALAALGLKEGDEVITSPFTFSATASAILMAGGIPRFADVDSHTFCIGKEEVKRVITKRTKAILPVHLFGQLADLRGLRELHLPIIEDACQAVGAYGAGSWAGTLGVAGVYSFNGSKNIPAGEAGALVTNSDKIAEKAQLLMNHAENFGVDWVGYNYRPNELTCCVAWHGMDELEARNKARISLAMRLYDELDRYADPMEETEWELDVKPPRLFDGSHIYYAYPLLLERRDRAEFIASLQQKDIPASGGYITPPLHHYPAFRKYAKGLLPVVDELSFKTLCLLSHVRPPATEADMEYTAKCIAEALR